MKNNLVTNAPSIILIVTVTFFTVSFMYNMIYCIVLGVDIELIPFTLSDYTLTVQSYFTSFISLFVGIMVGLFDRKNLHEYSVSHIKWKIPYICLIIMISISAVVQIIYQLYTLNIYYLDLSLIFIVSVFLVFVLNLPWKIDLVIYFLSFICILFIFAKQNVISSFLEEGTYLNQNNQKFRLLRTLEKGFLVASKDYHISFLYIDGETRIKFKPNEKLVKYLKSKKK